MKMRDLLEETVLNRAKAAGAQVPYLGESADGKAIVLDQETGKLYSIEVIEETEVTTDGRNEVVSKINS